jgi:hypothetical protein
MRRWLVGLCLCLAQGPLGAEEAWQSALGRMPLAANVRELGRTNCVDILWGAFRSNGVVKAVILMPGATDEWYTLRGGKVALEVENASLLDAVNALTNRTRIRATFRPPLLLLHTPQDVLEPLVRVEHEPTAEKIRRCRFAPHAVYNDRDWDALYPILKKWCKAGMRPWRYTEGSWHFYRHSFTGWDLTAWEALEATALAGKTKCTVQRGKVVFEVDLRLAVGPQAE